jgi:glycosyltransferase involved in cell wall biosynthesis
MRADVRTGSPEVSVIISTRNRADQIDRAVASVLANRHPSFELLVVDQSTDRSTEQTVQPYTSDPHFRYLHSTTRGLSAGQNFGLRRTTGQFVAFTDDDCAVPPDWISQIVDSFSHTPRVGAVFGAVAPAPDFDRTRGWLPTFTPGSTVTISTPAQVPLTDPMGAHMAFRREALERIGGFDEILGPGAPLRSAGDIDALYRTSLADYWVVIRHDLFVVHYGYRDYDSRAGSKLILDSLLANGAYYGKHIRCGDVVAVRLYGAELKRSMGSAITNLRHRRRPVGFRQVAMLVLGLAYSWHFAVDHSQRLFLTSSDRLRAPEHQLVRF